MTDKYAKLRKDVPQAIEEAKAEGGINHRAQMIADLLVERDDVLENGKQAVRWAPSSAYWSNELKRLFGEDAREGIDALEAQLRAAQSERDALREAIEEAIRLLGMDRPIDPTDVLRAALSGESNG